MPAAFFWNRRTIRFRLTGLVIACVLPVWLATGTIVHFVYQEKKRDIEAQLTQSAQNLQLALDQEIEVILSALVALGTSPALGAGDFDAFHAQARQLLRAYPGADVILADATGQQLVNSYSPHGSPLPRRGITSAVRRVFEQGRPGVSGLFKGAMTNRFMISVDAPVFHDGRVVYDLAMTLPTDRIVTIVSRHPLPSGWVGVVMDGDRVVVHHTLLPERYVGKTSPLPAEASALGAVREFLSPENVPSLLCTSRSATTDWSVAVHASIDDIWTELRHWLLWAIMGTSLLSVAGVILAVLIGRSISRSIGALVPPALDLAGGKPVHMDSLGLEETEAVGRALAEASGLLAQRTATLERSNRELEDFAAMASHDLQEPLRKIKVFGERLRENNAANLDEAGQDFLRRMESTVDRMETLILDLLEYSRVTTRPNPFVSTDLGTLAREAVVDVEALLGETGGRITVGKMPTAEVDAPQMRRAFQNLFSNALKFHGEAVPRITVSGTVVAVDGRPFARIVVADNGIGFDAQYLEKIFQPFQRLHGRSKFPGTGIGLAVVKKSVERHGGTVTAESKPGCGSTFILTVPLQQQMPES